MVDRRLAQSALTRDEEDYLEVLSDLVEKFEDHHYPIQPVSGLDALRHLIESDGKTSGLLQRMRDSLNLLCRKFCWADVGSIPDTSACWRVTSVSTQASSSTPLRTLIRLGGRRKSTSQRDEGLEPLTTCV